MKKQTIIICEKDKALSRSLALVLEPDYETYEISEFSSAAEMVEKVGANGLVLDLDYEFSIGTDYSIIKEFKKRFPDLRIISMYVYRKEHSEDEVTIRDFSQAVLYKPVDITQFLKIMKDLRNNGNGKRKIATKN